MMEYCDLHRVSRFHRTFFSIHISDGSMVSLCLFAIFIWIVGQIMIIKSTSNNRAIAVKTVAETAAAPTVDEHVETNKNQIWFDEKHCLHNNHNIDLRQVYRLFILVDCLSGIEKT